MRKKMKSSTILRAKSIIFLGSPWRDTECTHRCMRIPDLALIFFWIETEQEIWAGTAHAVRIEANPFLRKKQKTKNNWLLLAQYVERNQFREKHGGGVFRKTRVLSLSLLGDFRKVIVMFSTMLNTHVC